MKQLLYILLLTGFLVSCQDTTTEPEEQDSSIEHKVGIENIDLSQYSNPKHVLNPSQFAEWQEAGEDYVLIDVRKKEEFEMGHLPKAQQVWRTDISSQSYNYGGMRLSKDSLALLLGQLGATDKSKIVLYDSKGDVDAARLWWMITLYGHEDTYLLNGGLSNYEEKEWSKETFQPTAQEFKFNGAERKDLLATKEDILAAIEDEQTFILDCRTPEEFNGEKMKKGAFRSGHIPSAHHIEHSETIAYERHLTFRDYEDMRKRFEAVPRDKNIIVYCQSGVRSAMVTFALRELLGYSNVSNYDGSWIEWSYIKSLPIESNNTK